MGVEVTGELKEDKEGPVSGDCIRGGGVDVVVIVDMDELLVIIVPALMGGGLDCKTEIGFDV